MDLNLAGRTAVVTGASKGIGRAVAERLAAEGVHLHLVARTADDLENAAADIRKRHRVDVAVWPLDLSNGGNVDRLFAVAPDVDIVVNNAGAIPRGTIEEIEEEAWRAAWDLKLFGYINMCRRYFSAMKARGSGVIINVIGAGGQRVAPNYAVGAGGNAALMALTRALGSTSVQHGVRVVGINPGAIETDRLVGLLRHEAQRRFGDAERWQELRDPRFPPGQPDHIAALTAFLASDLSGFTTGTVITVDGGHSER